MNSLTATRIVKSVLQRTSEFHTLRGDYVGAPRDFYERLAETSGWDGQWAEAHALVLFAALSPAQRAIHFALDDDEASTIIMRSTIVARRRERSLERDAVLGFIEYWFVPDDPVDHLPQEELVAAFLGDPALAPPCADFTDEQWEQVKIATGVSQNEDDYRWTYRPDTPDLVVEDDIFTRYGI